MITNVRYPEIYPYNSNSLNLENIRAFQSNVGSNLETIDRRVQELEHSLEASVKFAEWVRAYHPTLVNEYHATQLALGKLEQA